MGWKSVKLVRNKNMLERCRRRTCGEKVAKHSFLFYNSWPPTQDFPNWHPAIENKTQTAHGLARKTKKLTERERNKQTDRQTDRQIIRQTEQTDREKDTN